MASRRTSTVPKSLKTAFSETKSVKGGNVTNKANNSGNEKKSVKSSGTIVKSRYLQSAEKTVLSKSDSSHNESMAPPPRPASPKARPRPASPKPRPKVCTPPRLQSTFSDGHSLCPDFDISAIKGVPKPPKSLNQQHRTPFLDQQHQNLVSEEKTVLERIAEPDWNPEIDKTEIEQQTLLLAYLTAKMEHNTVKLRAEAETRILQAMEEEESMRLEVLEKKRQHDFKEKSRLLSELLDLQIASLTPVADAATQFTKEYKSFAAAVDTTRHELAVKNFYMDGEPQDFLDKAESCLKDSETLLQQCRHGNTEDNCTSLGCLKSMKTTSKDISQHLSGAFLELLELSSLIGQQTIHVQQASEEEQLGTARTQKLFCSKP
uniref:HAUS augmin-like complex subunit 8 n=1 Tax=Neogobius melanostomus TaxID=47308 RepID=A0A8C6T3D1_9GOBI